MSRQRVQLNPEARWNGWEREDAPAGGRYRIFLACYDRLGLLERHGFMSEESALEFCATHPAPASYREGGK